jgi:hypothetical protein
MSRSHVPAPAIVCVPYARFVHLDGSYSSASTRALPLINALCCISDAAPWRRIGLVAVARGQPTRHTSFAGDSVSNVRLHLKKKQKIEIKKEIT